MKKIEGVAFYLYVVFLLIFPLGAVVRITPFTNVNLYPLDVVSFLIFTTSLFYIKRAKAQYEKIIVPIAIFNVIAFTSLVLNSFSLTGGEFLTSMSYLFRLNMYLSLLFVGIFGFSKLKNAFLKKIFLIVSLVVVLFGFIQYLLYNDLRNLYYLGWDEHLYRMFSTFLDPNFAGLFFSLLSIFLVGKILTQIKSIDKKSIMYAVFSCFTIVAMILTHSRTAILALIVGLILLMVTLKRVKLLIVLQVALFIGIFALSNSSIEGTNPFRMASSEARVISMREGVSIFLSSPIYGVGFNAYRYAQIDKGYRSSEQSKISNADAGSDSSLIFVLATTGVLGFISYLYIWKNIVQITINSDSNLHKKISLSIILALFIGSLFINALFYIPIISWVFIYLGLFVFSKED